MTKTILPKTLVHTHRILAGFLGIFIITHLLTHLTALGGANVHIAVLSVVQKTYQNWFIEPLLMLAILLQIYVGFKLLSRRWKQKHKGFWGWTQLISGILIIIFVLMHALAAVTTRYLLNVETNFYWVAGTLYFYPLAYSFIPYYFFGIFSIFAHIAAAIHFKFSGNPRWLAPLLMACGAIFGVIIVTIFAGGFYDIKLPQSYIDYYERYPQDYLEYFKNYL